MSAVFIEGAQRENNNRIVTPLGSTAVTHMQVTATWLFPRFVFFSLA